MVRAFFFGSRLRLCRLILAWRRVFLVTPRKKKSISLFQRKSGFILSKICMNKKEQKIYKVEKQATKTKTTTSFMHEKIMYIATNEVNLHSDLTEVAIAVLNELPGIGPQQ